MTSTSNARTTTTTTRTTTLEGQEHARRIAEWILEHRHLRTIADKDLFALIDFGIERLRTVPSFLEVRAPVIIFGDLHGQLPELLEFFKLVASELLELNAPRTNLLFLGDYVDRGKYSLEVITLLLCLKLLFPERINLLRGNHECSDVNKRYGFYSEIMAKKCGNYHLWTRFNQLFKELSVCALVSGKILCMHGGLPRPSSMQQWSDLTGVQKARTVSECYDDRPIVNDLLWADPTEKQMLKWGPDSPEAMMTFFNKTRNTSILFTDEYIQEFIGRFNPHIEAIVRAHEHTAQGYKPNQARNLCTIFSAPCYQDPRDRGAVLTIPADGDGRIKVTILEPLDKDSSSSSEQSHQQKEPNTPKPGGRAHN